MKKTIVTIILILIFSYLTIMAVPALNEADSNTINDNIAKLTNIQIQLQSSPITRSVSRLINSAIKIFTRAIANPGSSCPRNVEASLSKLDRAIDSFSKRSCEASKRKQCVQGELLDQILPEFQSAIDNLNQIALLDENENGIIDVCEDDPDGDGISGKRDNCPLVSNPEQKDVDGNRIGDACDLFLCCADSSLTFPINQCTRKTIKSCREEGSVVIGCLGSKTGRGGKEKDITFSTPLAQVILDENIINFAGDSMIIINTGFFPFDNSNGVLTGFNDFSCQDLNLVFTPPPGFPGGIFEVGPAGNGFETGPRNVIQLNGDDPSVIILMDFPITDPFTQQPFGPSMGDQLGFSFFTQDQIFASSPFNVFVDLDFNGNCRSPLSTSSGGSTTSSGGTVVTTTSSGGTTSSSSGGILTMVFGTSGGSLQDAINMSTVPGMTYMASYDCDDFAEDLGMELQGQGFNTTFTAIWMNNGMDGHAVTDVHTTSGGIIWIEPQNGMVINLDENMDGMVGFRDNMHSMAIMTTEGMSEIEVYMTRSDASMAGAPID